MRSELKLAFVGAGGMTKQHLERLKKIGGIKLKGICDKVKEKAESLASLPLPRG